MQNESIFSLLFGWLLSLFEGAEKTPQQIHEEWMQHPMGGYEPFVNGAAEHLLGLIVVGLIGWLVIWLARRSVRVQHKMNWVLSVSCVLSIGLSVTAMYVDFSHPYWGFCWKDMLPLHYCSIMEFLCPVALLTRYQWVRAVVFFGALVATSQALITPALNFGYPSLTYFAFFACHGLVVLIALYLPLAQGWSPRKYDLWRAFAFGILYIVLVHPINCLLLTNYGFTRHVPPCGSVLDFMGPWPWYLFALFVPALLLMFLFQLPWRKRLRREGTKA